MDDKTQPRSITFALESAWERADTLPGNPQRIVAALWAIASELARMNERESEEKPGAPCQNCTGYADAINKSDPHTMRCTDCGRWVNVPGDQKQ